jgi:hypothetical protein
MSRRVKGGEEGQADGMNLLKAKTLILVDVVKVDRVRDGQNHSGHKILD